MLDPALEIIAIHSREGAFFREQFLKAQAENIRLAALNCAAALAKGGKLLICGNGKNSAFAQYLAALFANKFLLDRPALPAIALTENSSILTAMDNNFSFEDVFSRQLEALGRDGDVLLAISSTGQSANTIRAMQTAKKFSISGIAITGCGGGKLASICDISISSPYFQLPLLQEAFLAAVHLFCQLTDFFLFENIAELKKFLKSEKGE